MSSVRFGQDILTAAASVAAPAVISGFAAVSWPVLILGIGAIGLVGVAAVMASDDDADDANADPPPK